jgi:hypothetical protein
MMQKFPTRIIGYTGFILTLSYLFYFLREVDMSLIYYWQQTIPTFLAEYMQSPGGLSDFLGDRFLEYMTQPFQGSMGVALLVAIVFFSLQVIFRQFKGNPIYFVFLLAALIPFILLFAHYTLPAGLILSVTTGFLLAVVHSLYSPRNLVARSVYNFITGLVVYLVAGAAGLLVLLQVIIVQIILSKKYMKLVSILPLLIVPILYLLFNLSFTLRDAYLGPFLARENIDIPPILYCSIFSPLLILLVVTGLNYLFSRFTLKRSSLLSGTGIVIVLISLVISSRASINDMKKSILETVQASSGQEWEKVLEVNSEQLYINKVVQLEINRALYHTGQLLDNLFLFPQQYGEKGIFLEEKAYSNIAITMCEFYCELGYANETRHWASEAHIGYMRHPIVLKHLILSYLAIGNNKTALKYLRVLSGSRLYKEWCNQIHEMIENNTIRDDPTIQSFILNNPKDDFFASTSDPTKKLNLFYKYNLNNHVAFEFLMASYLLQHEVGTLVGKLPDFRRFGYEMLPRAVEEAMLIYLTKKPEGNQSMEGYSLRKKTLEEFKDFSILVSTSGTRAAKMHNASKYKNTYWYYVMFSSPYASKN